jgi:hypothetical protein
MLAVGRFFRCRTEPQVLCLETSTNRNLGRTHATQEIFCLTNKYQMYSVLIFPEPAKSQLRPIVFLDDLSGTAEI